MSYGIGQIIHFECKDSNYEMDGPNQLECLDDGTWSDMLPTCMKKRTCEDVPRYGQFKIYHHNLAISGPEVDKY